jgi:SnoaL-like polyketide cyclase
MPSIPLPDTLIGRLVPPGARRDDYTEEEAANIEHVIKLRLAKIEDRPTFSHSTGEPPNRFGLQVLTQRAASDGRPGHFVDGLSDRVDEFIDIIAKGDRVWTVFQVSGTHTGVLWGFPPTGKRISVLEFGIYRLSGGKIAEAWYFGDELAMLEQLRGEVKLGPGDD